MYASRGNTGSSVSAEVSASTKIALNNNRTSSESMEGIYRNSVMHFCKETGIDYVPGRMGIHELRSIHATKDMKGKISLNCTFEELEMIVNGCKERGHSIVTALQHYCLGK